MTHASWLVTVSHRDENRRLENRFDSFECGAADDDRVIANHSRRRNDSPGNRLPRSPGKKLQIARANSLNVRYRRILRDAHA